MGTYSWYLDYCRAVNAAVIQHPDWRRGQTYVNILTDLDPEAMRELQDAGLSPFLDDSKIPQFLTALLGYRTHKNTNWWTIP